MKKFLLTMAVAVTALFATAQTKTYTDDLTVTIDGVDTEPQETTIYVEKNSDGTYTLSLNRFTLGGMFKVGNIVLNNIAATEEGGIKSFTTNQTIQITAGDENVDDWMGPMLGDVPVDLKGKMTDGSLYCTIGIDLTANMGQVIDVTFGKDIKATRNYTDALTVTINGNSSAPQQTTINVDERADGTYTLSLNNFMLDEMAVGNIVLHNITATENGNVNNFATEQTIVITEGDIADQSWLGPQLGNVPVKLEGKMTEYKLYCDIDIEMAMLGQTIKVVFGQADLMGIEGTVADGGERIIFDITGRRVDAITTPGIYIINGKKQVIR